MVKQLTKTELHNGYNALKLAIDEYIKRNELTYELSDNAPNSYKELIDQVGGSKHYVVYNGGDHGLLGGDYNTKFRCVHDHGHVTKQLNFQRESEIILGYIQASSLSTLTYELTRCYTLASIVYRIVLAEIVDQINYYFENRQYIANQSEFIYKCFNIAA